MTTNEEQEVAAMLRNSLNRHGYSFHYAVMETASKMSSANQTNWVLYASELPINVKDIVSHVDFVYMTKSKFFYLIGECKRVDPAKGRWCFVRAPYTWRNPNSSEVIFERFECSPLSNSIYLQPCIDNTSREPFHIAMELRTNKKGDGLFQDSRAINEAITQTLRGTSGFVNHLFEHSRRKYLPTGLTTFIPAIFTTAEIWVSDVSLEKADITTGEIDLGSVSVRKVKWIWFNHNRSQTLSHNIGNQAHDPYTKNLRIEFTRSVAIIGVDGIEEFLKTDIEGWLS